MQKIPTIFQRDIHNPKRVTRERNLACDWVFYGKGIATRKFDGTCTMLDEHGTWWARREVKPFGTEPLNYVKISTDAVTGKTVGWEPIEQSGFAKWHAEALEGTPAGVLLPGTYELVGPKINGNPEGFFDHALIAHAQAERYKAPRDFDRLCEWLLARPGMEGLVWHHEDGRMAKIKRRDFA